MPETMILLVEGKASNPNSLFHAIQNAGYQTAVYHTGKKALDSLKEKTPDLVVFNAASMRSNGTRSCRRLRHVLGEDIPIIHTRNSGEVEQLEAKADVYLEHPFTSRKLFNRIRMLLPVDDTTAEVVRFGEIKFYPTKPSVDVCGKGEQRLTPKLAQLLQEFLRHPNEVVTRVQLMQNVWKTDYVGDTRTLDVHIRWVREVIEDNPAKPKILKTVRGRGYILSQPSKPKK